MICTGCNQDKPIKARGLCGACYTQWQKYGTTVRVRTRGLKGKPCIVEGCDKIAHGRGLCHMHLQRERKTGVLSNPRENKPEPVTHHPLYPQWVDFQRANNPRPIVQEWKESFEAFLAGVGPRPSKRHRLYRTYKELPLGPGNFEWRLALVEKLPGEAINDYNKRYRKAHLETYGTDYHTAGLRNKYNITLQEFQAMLKAQNYRCAICGGEENTVRNGRKIQLSVDHNHLTGKVRGLLCRPCNKGIGHLKDDIDLMLSAAAYLRKHDEAMK